jgi:hypothetical protein
VVQVQSLPHHLFVLGGHVRAVDGGIHLFAGKGRFGFHA